VLPGPTRTGMVRITQALLRRQIRQFSIGRVQALISAWPLFDVFGASSAEVSVFWAQDDFASAAKSWGMSAKRIARGEAKRAETADLVVAANPIVFNRWQSVNSEVELIPYGCDISSFAEDEDTNSGLQRVHLKGPIAILVGQINFRVDLSLLEAVVARGLSLLLVGPINHPESDRMLTILRHRNVQAVGEQLISDLPFYLRRSDVGIVPYGNSGFNDASFPLKTLEYLAARLPVVSTELPAPRWLDTSLVEVAHTPKEFAQAVAVQAGKTHVPELREARWRFAMTHSYETRAKALMHAIERSISTCRPGGASRQTQRG